MSGAGSEIEVIQFLDADGNPVKTYAAPFKIKSGANISFSVDENKLVIAGAPGGVSNHSELNQLAFESSGHTGFSAASHAHSEADVTNLVTDLAGKAPTSHAHAEDDVTNLVTDLAGKEPTLTKGNLTATSPIQLDQTRQVIGGAAVISLLAAYTPREKLSAARTYYVRTDGSDSNDGSANDAAHAFLTIQKGVNVWASLDTNGYNVTISIADGTHSAGATIVAGRVGQGNLYITGNMSTPGNCYINGSSHLFNVIGWNGGDVYIRGFKLNTSSGSAIVVAEFAVVGYGYIEFAALSGAYQYHLTANLGGILFCVGNYTISGGAYAHFQCELGGVFKQASAKTITITGTPNFTIAFAWSLECSSIRTGGWFTFSGSATGKRYHAELNGVVDTQGAGIYYFPGDVLGTTATGGQYA